MKNEMNVRFKSVSQNEAFARVTVASFISQLDPTMEELTEIKTVVSEAVTNAIIHGYNNEPDHMVDIYCAIDARHEITLVIRDNGEGIDNIDVAMEPLYTSKPELERSGMGFTIMENFMDAVDIESSIDEGTVVHMKKKLISTKVAQQ
ncbi:MAG TPA: anti-sigma F factor [Bacillota bacterium]|nr:anti-sigma F factor [Bacillota bacterium]